MKDKKNPGQGREGTSSLLLNVLLEMTENRGAQFLEFVSSVKFQWFFFCDNYISNMNNAAETSHG